MNNSIVLEEDGGGGTRLVASLEPSGDIKLADEECDGIIGWLETDAKWYNPDSLERALRLVKPANTLARCLLDAIQRLGQSAPGSSDEDLLVEAHRAYIDAVRAGRTLADLERRIGKKKES